MNPISGIDSALLSGPPVSLISQMSGGIVLFCGDAGLSEISSQLVGWRLARQEQVLFLDGDNRFNPYPIAEWAKRIGADPGRFLSSIFISRAFTCHQMASLITRRLGAAIARHHPRLVLLAEPLATFYDEAIPFGERKTLLSRSIEALVRSAGEGVLIAVLTAPPRPVPKTASLFSILRNAADRLFAVHTDEREIFITEERDDFGGPPRRIGRH
ncbi:MAG: hypothetical protein WAO55_08445 [Candidatus Manganitrophaceae bacterium]